MKVIVLVGSKGTIASRILQSSKHSFIEIDLDNEAAFYTLKRIDIVLHFGEMSSPSLSMHDSLSNIEKTIAYYKYALKVGCESFFYASSHRVYGSWEEKLTPPFVPITNYGKGKLICEILLRELSVATTGVVVLRIGTLLGEDDVSNQDLESENSEWKGKYDFTRTTFKDFVSRLDKLVAEKHTGYSVLNVLPKSSLLNKKFDGKNFYNY